MSDPKLTEDEQINEETTEELSTESLDDVAGGVRPPS